MKPPRAVERRVARPRPPGLPGRNRGDDPGNRRGIYVLPNLFTSASLFSALASIIAAHNGDFRQACYFILLSAILDALDGPVARLTNSTSSFGLQLDSLADLVAFGVAPSFLMYTKLAQIDSAAALPSWASQLALGVCALFAVSSAIRLARFNVQAEAEEKLHFTGMPTPAAAGVVVSTFLMIEGYAQYLGETKALHRSILVLMVILSYLMVSTVPFPKLRALFRRSQRSVNGLVTVVFFACLLVAFRNFMPEIVWTIFMSYTVIAVVRTILTKRASALRGYSPGATLVLDGDEGDDEDPGATRD